MDVTNGFDVCIGNYGYYNEGELHDAWLHLPSSDEKIREFLIEHRLYDAMHEEIYISDYDGYPFGLENLFSETTQLDDLNLLAKLCVTTNEDLDTLEEYLDLASETPKTVYELMNLIMQADEVPYYQYDFSFAYHKNEWGQTFISQQSPEENFGWQCLEQTPDLLEMLQKYGYPMDTHTVERYGEEQGQDCNLGQYGYVDCCQDGPDLEYYDRDDLEEEINSDYRRYEAEHETSVVPNALDEVEVVASIESVEEEVSQVQGGER